MEIDLNKPLGRGDVPEIVGKILDAKTKSELFGRVLKLEPHLVSGIHAKHKDPDDCLFHIMDEFVKQVDPVPTWRVILAALRHRTIRLNRLADEIERKDDLIIRADKRKMIPHGLITFDNVAYLVSLLVLLLAILIANIHVDCYQVGLCNSESLPSVECFVGREKDIYNITGYLDSYVQVVHIVGPPGFGKSTLAMKIGDILVRKWVNVHYVDLRMVKDSDTMAEKFISNVVEATKNEATKNKVTFDRLEKWVRKQYSKTVIILDNCDMFIEHAKDDFLESMSRLMRASSRRNVRYIITSQRWVANIGNNFKLHDIYILSSDAAIELLSKVAPSLTQRQKTQIAGLTGNVPLALSIIGSIFNFPHAPSAHAVVEQLRSNPLDTLSRVEFDKSINISISIAFNYLTPVLKKLCVNLSLYPSSFNEESALSIFGCSSKMLDELVRRSLLQRAASNRRVRFFFHQILKKYLHQFQNDSELKYNFSSKFQHYYAKILYNSLPHNDAPDFVSLSDEIHNIVHITTLMKSHKHVENTFFAIKVMVMNEVVMAQFCRISMDIPIHMLGVLDSYTVDERRRVNSFFDTYVEVAIFASKSFNSTNTAIKLLLQKETDVLQGYKSKLLSFNAYTKFYTALGGYYEQNGDMVNSSHCHFRIIQELNHKINDCHPHCDYLGVSIAYENTGYNTQAHYFRKLAYKHQYKVLGPVTQMKLCLGLYYDYASDGNDISQAEKLESVLNEGLYQTLINAHKIECDMDLYYMAIKFFRDHNMEEIVIEVQDKMFQCMSTCDCSGSFIGGVYSGNIITLYKDLVQNSPNKCFVICCLNYAESALKAYSSECYNLSLQLGEQSYNHAHIPELKYVPSIIIGISLYQLRNYSKAIVRLKYSLPYLNRAIGLDYFHKFSRELRFEACHVLLKSGDFGNIECYVYMINDILVICSILFLDAILYSDATKHLSTSTLLSAQQHIFSWLNFNSSIKLMDWKMLNCVIIVLIFYFIYYIFYRLRGLCKKCTFVIIIVLVIMLSLDELLKHMH